MSISKNIQDLAALYQVKIDALTDTLQAGKAQIALDAWIVAEQAYQENIATTAQNYTGPGMTISKRALSSSRQARDGALADLEGYLGTGEGGMSFVDFGGCL